MSDQDISTVVIVSENNELFDQVGKTVDFKNAFEVSTRLKFSNNLTEKLGQIQPDILLLDFATSIEELEKLIDELTIQHPFTSIIVTIPKKQSKYANRIMLAGARAFLISPFTSEELALTLQRVKELQQRVLVQTEEIEETVEHNELQTLVVFSPRGGGGCTTIAINLAIAINKLVKKETLLFDGKIIFGDVDLMLNLRARNSLADLITHSGNLDEILVRDVVSEHVSGISILPCPESPSVGQGIKSEDLYQVVLELQKIYPYLVIDSGSSLTENTVTLMDLAGKIILVITPDLPAIRNAKKFLTVCRTLNYPTEKIQIVLNQFNKKSAIKEKEIESALNKTIFEKIPSDEVNVFNSMNRGVPLIYEKSNNAVSRAINATAKALIITIEDDILKFQRGESNSQDLLNATSRLG
jgi:pilus assembly protein CpaE